MTQQGWPGHIKEHGINQILHGTGSKRQGLTDLQESLSSSFLFGYGFISLKPGFLTQRFAHVCCHLHALLFPAKVQFPTYPAWYVQPFLDLCASSLREGHADLLCIIPNSTDVTEVTYSACDLSSISSMWSGQHIWHVVSQNDSQQVQLTHEYKDGAAASKHAARQRNSALCQTTNKKKVLFV
jgi:hypothetical protein